MASSDGTISDTLQKFRRAREASLLAPSKPVSKDKQAVSKSSLKRAATSSDGVPRASRALKKPCSGVGPLSSASRSGVSTTSDIFLVIDDLNESHFSHDLEAFRELGLTATLDDVQSSLFKVNTFFFFCRYLVCLAVHRSTNAVSSYLFRRCPLATMGKLAFKRLRRKSNAFLKTTSR